MKETKYIVFDSFLSEDMIIFGATQTHSEVTQRLGMKRDQLLSAGFLSIGQNDSGEVIVRAYGHSTSLNLDSREEEDSRLASRVLGLMW